MKTNLDKTTYFKLTNGDEVTELLKGTDIGKELEAPLHLVKLNKYPIVNIVLKHIEKGDIVLMYNEKSVRSFVRFVKDDSKSKVYVNLSPFTTSKNDTYNIDSVRLYSLLLGAMVTLYHDRLVKDREYLAKNVDIYLTLMTQIIARREKFFNTAKNESFKYHFIMTLFYLYKNTTPVSDLVSYAIKLSEITKEDADVIMELYGEYLDPKNKDKLTYEILLEEVLKKEFKFLKKEFNVEAVITLISMTCGGFMCYMIEEMSVIGTLMMNYVVKSSKTLLDKGVYQGLVKSKDYGRLLDALAKVSKY